MSLVSGIVNSIDDGIVRTGRSIGKPYKNIILTTGNKLTAFDLSFVADVKVGKEYTFPIETSGQYVNIVGAVTPVIQTGGVVEQYKDAVAKEIEEKSSVKMFPVSNKDEAIRKAVALKASVEFLVGAGGRIEGDFTAEHVTLLAKKFEEYLK